MIISIKDESNFEALQLEDVLPNAGGFQHVLVDEAKHRKRRSCTRVKNLYLSTGKYQGLKYPSMISRKYTLQTIYPFSFY